ncbi:MAG: DUF2177 family protein [Alphaproteobacteria bacterium]|nr:DUF2177 family protein [Alphaproteobacteria bacterium]
MAYLITYVVCVVVMGGLDFLWLTNTSKALYQKDLGALLAPDPNMVVAVIFYLLYIVGIQIFAVRPALEAGDWKTAALFGALFGFFTYATYDLTNMATMKVWTLRVTLYDIAWGTILTGITASAGAFSALRFAK